MSVARAPAEFHQSVARPWLACGDDYVTVRIEARPGAGRRQIIRLSEQGLVVGLLAPPEKGKANDELIDLIARATRVPRSAVTILYGAGSRHKTLRIASDHPAALGAVVRGLIPAK